MFAKQSIQSLRTGKHFSASALKTFLMCPWKFRLQYVEGAIPEFRPSALVLGKAVHEALAAHHQALKDAKPLSEPEVTGHFDATFDAQLDVEIPLELKKNETVDGLRESGRALIAVYLRDAVLGRIVAVEEPFSADLVDPRTGEVLEPTLVGVFDLVETDEEGQVVVAEIKTAARRWSTGQVELDLQGSLYAEVVAQAGLLPNGREALIRYDVLVKNKTAVLDRQYAVRRPGDRELALMIAVDALKAIEAGSFYRNPGWACDGCPFRRKCGI